MGDAAGEAIQGESTLSEAAFNRESGTQAQCAKTLLFALDDVTWRHQALFQAGEPQLFSCQAGSAGVVETLRQLAQFGLLAAQLFGRMNQPPRQKIQPLRFVLLFANMVMLKLTGQVSQLQQQFLARRAGEFGRRRGGRRAQVGGNYLNSQLLKLEAVQDGYEEAIALDVQGYVSEGSGENLFAVYKNEIITPPVSSSILSGITRDSVMRLATDMGYKVREAVIPREMLYIVDELFFTGTAVEVTPVSSVDRINVGAGERGPVTKALQDAFFGIVKGELPDRYGWLSMVPQSAAKR